MRPGVGCPTIALGETKTRMITNDKAANCRIKHVINDNGGTAVASSLDRRTGNGLSPASLLAESPVPGRWAG